MGSVRLCAVQFMKHFALHLQAWFNNNLFTENKSIKNITNLEKSQLILKKKITSLMFSNPTRVPKTISSKNQVLAFPTVSSLFRLPVNKQSTVKSHTWNSMTGKYRTFQESVPANTLTQKKNIKRQLTTQILQRVSPCSGDLSENGLSLS